MSSGQKPRNPYYFPRMKVRGARRKRMRAVDKALAKYTKVLQRLEADSGSD